LRFFVWNPVILSGAKLQRSPESVRGEARLSIPDHLVDWHTRI